MKKKTYLHHVIATGILLMMIASCSSASYLIRGHSGKLPPFSRQHWRVDPRNGHAISSSGLELGFGYEWRVTDTILFQTPARIATYPKLAHYLANGISQFPEIAVDSIYFYNPYRRLLFATYHQVKSLKPTIEISLHNDSIPVYSKEYARIFGHIDTHVEDTGWENGPISSVYSNMRYSKKDRQFVLLQRIPYRGKNIAVFHICTSRPKKGKWWEDYPYYIFWRTDFGNTDNIEHIASYLHNARTVAVANLKLAKNNTSNKELNFVNPNIELF